MSEKKSMHKFRTVVSEVSSFVGNPVQYTVLPTKSEAKKTNSKNITI